MPYRTPPPMDASFTLDLQEIQEAVIDWLKKHKGVSVLLSDDLKWTGTAVSYNGRREPVGKDIKITVTRTQFTAKDHVVC
jgi:hypothetical protein